MNTLEMTYVMGITLLVIASLVTGSIRLHEKVTGFSKAQLTAEIKSHSKEGEKEFMPEAFMRRATLLESLTGGQDKEKNE